MRLAYLVLILSLSGVVGWTTLPKQYDNLPGTDQWIDKNVQAIGAEATNLNPEVLKRSLTAYERAKAEGKVSQDVITIIDYSKPSTERRLWVVDLKTDKVLFNTYVAHGKNSGGLMATSFSNSPESLKSSIGVFVTDTTYTGHDGYSLRIKGLEHGINDNVYDRHVIFHGARYVSEAYAKARGMMGRSWGCMAVSLKVIKPIIETIKNHALVVAYYPDKNWLRNSPYVRSM